MFGVTANIDGLYASLLAGAISTIGILSVRAFGAAAERNSSYFSAFAVGLLSVGVVFHLIPEALDSSSFATGWIAGGFALMVLIGIGVELATSRGPHGAALSFGYASIIALAAHSFLDGVIYASAFGGEVFTGWMTTGGLLLHEFPEGIIAYFLLAQAGLSKMRSTILAFLAASGTTVAGAVLANTVVAALGDVPITALLGAAAGALIYVLIVHLGPHAAKAPRKRGYLFAQLGVAVGALALIVHSIGGGHGH
ncbi:MAG: ZIP family metal transporter [Pseudomonadota bacterium]